VEPWNGAGAGLIEAALTIAKAKASEDETLIAHQRLQIAKLTRQRGNSTALLGTQHATALSGHEVGDKKPGARAVQHRLDRHRFPAGDKRCARKPLPRLQPACLAPAGPAADKAIVGPATTPPEDLRHVVTSLQAALIVERKRAVRIESDRPAQPGQCAIQSAPPPQTAPRTP
jgi:hypothetical protein